LTEEVCATMPEIERETKSRILEKNMNTIANALPEFVNAKFNKYFSFVGVAGSTVALALLNPFLLGLGIPAYCLGQYLSKRRQQIQKTVFPHEFRARNAAWDQQDKAIRNPELYVDKKKQATASKKAQQDLFEVTEVRRKRQIPLILISAATTALLTGVALAASWGTMSLAALAGVYAATNAFLGSVQSWVMADYGQKEILRDMMKNYNEIKHQPEFDLNAGKQRLADKVDTIHIDRIVYAHRKKDNPIQRKETPILSFSTDFYLKPGINVLGGVSGAGKTTLYKLLRHADDLQGGSISFGTMENGKFTGEKLTNLPLEEASKVMAFSLPELRHVENVTAIELIKISNPNLSLESLQELAKLFSIPLWEDKECKKEKSMVRMSSGEKKRVLCVSALVSPRNILVLDEPTSGVDPKNVETILGAINELGKEKTIIYTTHHPEELLSLNLSNIIDLEQKKSADGTVLPTDVRIYPCETPKDKEDYIYFCRNREPKKQENKETTYTTQNITDILEANVPPQQTKSDEHTNRFLQDLKTAEQTAYASHLHSIVKKTSSHSTEPIQFIIDKILLNAIKRRADKKRHKRICEKLDASR